jgi:GH15 family glucan-1,4-alpha-glucosidase
MDALHVARMHGLGPSDGGWSFLCALMEAFEKIWSQPDEGIWEVRNGRRQFTYSKVMAWVAFDRAVISAETFGLPGPVERWRALRDQVHDEVCHFGFNPRRNSFTQYYGGEELDASLLLIPLVGFLPADDPRIAGTVAAIEQDLVIDGLVQRYPSDLRADGLPIGEGLFLACSFWLADNYLLLGRRAEAEALFGRLVLLCNDVGLLSEEYDPVRQRLVGNFPQAFSHIALVNTAHNLTRETKSVDQRSGGATRGAKKA